jgi:hypothetical protein
MQKYLAFRIFIVLIGHAAAQNKTLNTAFLPLPNIEISLCSNMRKSSFTTSGGLDSDFNRDRVRKFFFFLQEVGLSASQMDMAKQFINSHLRCELKNRLIAAKYQNPYLGNPRVGEAVEVAGIINDVRGQKACKYMDECIDLHAEVDNYYMEKQQD